MTTTAKSVVTAETETPHPVATEIVHEIANVGVGRDQDLVIAIEVGKEVGRGDRGGGRRGTGEGTGRLPAETGTRSGARNGEKKINYFVDIAPFIVIALQQRRGRRPQRRS